MKKQILLSAVLACISVFSAAAQKEPVDYVNPFVGTTNYGTTNLEALTPHGIDVGDSFQCDGGSRRG